MDSFSQSIANTMILYANLYKDTYFDESKDMNLSHQQWMSQAKSCAAWGMPWCYLLQAQSYLSLLHQGLAPWLEFRQSGPHTVRKLQTLVDIFPFLNLLCQKQWVRFDRAWDFQCYLPKLLTLSHSQIAQGIWNYNRPDARKRKNGLHQLVLSMRNNKVAWHTCSCAGIALLSQPFFSLSMPRRSLDPSSYMAYIGSCQESDICVEFHKIGLFMLYIPSQAKEHFPSCACRSI